MQRRASSTNRGLMQMIRDQLVAFSAQTEILFTKLTRPMRKLKIHKFVAKMLQNAYNPMFTVFRGWKIEAVSPTQCFWDKIPEK